MAWWIDSTQGYHAVMSVALIPLWMLSGAMFPPTGSSRWLAALTAPRPDDLRRLRRSAAASTAPRCRSTWSRRARRWSRDLAIVAGFAVVALAGAVALCRRRA